MADVVLTKEEKDRLSNRYDKYDDEDYELLRKAVESLIQSRLDLQKKEIREKLNKKIINDIFTKYCSKQLYDDYEVVTTEDDINNLEQEINDKIKSSLEGY